MNRCLTCSQRVIPAMSEVNQKRAVNAETALVQATSNMRERLFSHSTVTHVGRVVRAVGTSMRISGLPVRIGQRCRVEDRHTGLSIQADVVGLEQGDAVLVPLSGLQGIATDSEVRVVAEQITISVGPELLGRVVDGFGVPLDELPGITSGMAMPMRAQAPNPLNRQRVCKPFPTGVKVIDALVPVGVGQRLGIFAPAGVGKSTLLGMLAAMAESDVIVVGLIGERGREVREFLEDALCEQTRAKSVVVVATSDRAAMERVSAAETATAIAEGFRDQGKHVLLLMDSVTRYARAVREMGLAVGEPPVRQGFPPSVFAELPRLFERSGNNAIGCISAFYTVLTDDDSGLDPIAEETRSILDGHIVLARSLAEKNQFPAVDVLSSQSRLFTQLASAEQQSAAMTVRALLAKFREIEFLIQVGEYKAGSDSLADAAIALMPDIEKLLCQHASERSSFSDTTTQLCTLADKANLLMSANVTEQPSQMSAPGRLDS